MDIDPTTSPSFSARQYEALRGYMMTKYELEQKQRERLGRSLSQRAFNSIGLQLEISKLRSKLIAYSDSYPDTLTEENLEAYRRLSDSY